MSYFEEFGVLTGVGVDILKLFGVRAGVFKPEIGVESEFKNMTPLISDPDSKISETAHLLTYTQHFDLSLVCDRSYSPIKGQRFDNLPCFSVSSIFHNCNEFFSFCKFEIIAK